MDFGLEFDAGLSYRRSSSHVGDTKALGAGALLELVRKSRSIAPVDCVPVPQRPQVYLGEQYVNNPMLSDVTFLVEGRQFHAHRIALLASSDTFRAMFDGNYIEKDASSIPIPNIRYTVFHAMMLCIYTGEAPHLHGAMTDLQGCMHTAKTCWWAVHAAGNAHRQS